VCNVYVYVCALTNTVLFFLCNIKGTLEDVETLEKSGNKAVNAMYISSLEGNHTDKHMGQLASAAFVESKYKNCLYFSERAYHEQMQLRAMLRFAQSGEPNDKIKSEDDGPSTEDLVQQKLQQNKAARMKHIEKDQDEDNLHCHRKKLTSERQSVRRAKSTEQEYSFDGKYAAHDYDNYDDDDDNSRPRGGRGGQGSAGRASRRTKPQTRSNPRRTLGEPIPGSSSSSRNSRYNTVRHGGDRKSNFQKSASSSSMRKPHHSFSTGMERRNSTRNNDDVLLRHSDHHRQRKQHHAIRNNESLQRQSSHKRNNIGVDKNRSPIIKAKIRDIFSSKSNSCTDDTDDGANELDHSNSYGDDDDDDVDSFQQDNGSDDDDDDGHDDKISESDNEEKFSTCAPSDSSSTFQLSDSEALTDQSSDHDHDNSDEHNVNAAAVVSARKRRQTMADLMSVPSSSAAALSHQDMITSSSLHAIKGNSINAAASKRISDASAALAASAEKTRRRQTIVNIMSKSGDYPSLTTTTATATKTNTLRNPTAAAKTTITSLTTAKVTNPLESLVSGGRALKPPPPPAPSVVHTHSSEKDKILKLAASFQK